MNYRVLAVCAASLSLSAVTPVLAQGSFGPLSIESCPDYVAKAMSQVQMATGCNVAGGRWSVDPPTIWHGARLHRQVPVAGKTTNVARPW